VTYNTQRYQMVFVVDYVASALLKVNTTTDTLAVFRSSGISSPPAKAAQHVSTPRLAAVALREVSAAIQSARQRIS
jgi:hypothetical protein